MDTRTDQEQSLFDVASAIENPSEREIFLDQSCNGDQQLRSRITKLLAAHTRTDQFFSECVSNFSRSADELRTTPDAASIHPVTDEVVGTFVGRYKLVQQLGVGGCGVVYLAEQEKPVRRRVALKVIKLGMDTRSVIARFEAERQALALMDHPNIARVLDAGATESGRPYFVMELVRGVKITTYCDEHQVAAPQRLDLFIQVCQAIQHAHQKGVIHRDIKPSNILVSLNDGVPVPKVIDFGIAKATVGKLADDTAFTAEGQFVGTPAYMSPEQAEMSGLDVDTRSDIYSLGVLLYELLTGRTPFDQKKLVNSSLEEMRRTLREDDPRRPSTLLTQLSHTDLTATAERRHIEPPKLIQSLKGDLDWIVMKTLEKDRRHRYETANALVMDVQRYLNDEPVFARPPSQFYRLKKLIRRNKAVYASGLMVAITLVAGLGVSTRLFFKEREARVEAEQARANEILLRQEAEAREKVTQAAVLVNHRAMVEADALLDTVPAALLSPSMEATKVFRSLGEWNLLQGEWKNAANRYNVVVRVNQVDKSDQTEAATADLLLAAPLLIEVGDLAGYERIRRTALSRLDDTTNPQAAEHLIKTSLLLPAAESLMRQMNSLAQIAAGSLAPYNPKTSGDNIRAAWCSLALALLEYRRGDFKSEMDWLQKCDSYLDQPPSCVASVHILRSMAWFHLGKIEQAASELKQGKAIVDDHFQKPLEMGNDKTGWLAGWIMNLIFVHEAEDLAGSSPQASH